MLLAEVTWPEAVSTVAMFVFMGFIVWCASKD